jgi:hypothetical protein
MVRELLAEIEGTAFALRVGVASGLKHFGRLLRDQKAVGALARAAQSNVEVARVVFSRLVRLSRLRIDPRYENPSDVAVAGYLLVLSATELYAAAVDEVLASQNLWWAAHMARAAVEDARHVSAAETLVIGETAVDPAAPLSSVGAMFPSGCLDETFRRLCEGWSDATGSGDDYSDEVITEVAASDSQYALAA